MTYNELCSRFNFQDVDRKNNELYSAYRRFNLQKTRRPNHVLFKDYILPKGRHDVKVEVPHPPVGAEDLEAPEPKKSRPSFDGGYKEWNSLQERTKREITKPIMDLIDQISLNRKIEKRDLVEYIYKKITRKSGSDTIKTINPETAMAIVSEGRFGRGIYQQIKSILKQSDLDILPSWKKVKDFQIKVTPKIQDLVIRENETEVFSGVYFDYSESMKITSSQIFKVIDLNLENFEHLTLDIKFGFDGSGGHKIFHQVGNMDTENLIMSMFCPLKLYDSANKSVLWEQSAPNSEFSSRPLLIVLGKENKENSQNLKVLEKDRKKLADTGIKVDETTVKVITVAHCLDRKAANLYTGLGGAFCDVCTSPKQDCHDIGKVEEGFKINRDITHIKAAHDMLVDAVGDVQKRPQDYAVRQGITSCPLTEINAYSHQVLHHLLRNGDHFTKTCIFLIAGVKEWSESKFSESSRFCSKAKASIQEKLLQEKGIRWDFVDSCGQGGSTTTGNTVRRILFDSDVRKVFTENITSSEDRKAAEKYGFMLAIILRIMQSSQEIDVERYEELCKELYVHLLTELKWVSITPSLHKLLGHSAELIEANGRCGLKKLSEEGMEANNKRLREVRLKLSRKSCQRTNLQDCLTRLWIGSDPIVAKERAKGLPSCTICLDVGHTRRGCTVSDTENTKTKEDKIVLSFFVK